MRAAYNDVVWAAVTTTKKYTTCNQQAGKLTDKHITTTRKPARNPARIAQVADLISIKLYMHNIRPNANEVEEVHKSCASIAGVLARLLAADVSSV